MRYRLSFRFYHHTADFEAAPKAFLARTHRNTRRWLLLPLMDARTSQGSAIQYPSFLISFSLAMSRLPARIHERREIYLFSALLSYGVSRVADEYGQALANANWPHQAQLTFFSIQAMRLSLLRAFRRQPPRVGHCTYHFARGSSLLINTEIRHNTPCCLAIIRCQGQQIPSTATTSPRHGLRDAFI